MQNFQFVFVYKAIPACRLTTILSELTGGKGSDWLRGNAPSAPLPRWGCHCFPGAGVSVIDHYGGAPRARPVHCTLGWVDPCHFPKSGEAGRKISCSGGKRSHYPPQYTHCVRKRRNIQFFAGQIMFETQCMC